MKLILKKGLILLGAIGTPTAAIVGVSSSGSFAAPEAQKVINRAKRDVQGEPIKAPDLKDKPVVAKVLKDNKVFIEALKNTVNIQKDNIARLQAKIVELGKKIEEANTEKGLLNWINEEKEKELQKQTDLVEWFRGKLPGLTGEIQEKAKKIGDLEHKLDFKEAYITRLLREIKHQKNQVNGVYDVYDNLLKVAQKNEQTLIKHDGFVKSLEKLIEDYGKKESPEWMYNMIIYKINNFRKDQAALKTITLKNGKKMIIGIKKG